MPPVTPHASGSGMQTPHRRVDEVADAGHNHARYKRLSHQKQDAAVNGDPLSGDRNLGRPEIEETVETTGKYSSKFVQ